jgi:AAA+ ATPase superfamily predicted ATPase
LISDLAKPTGPLSDWGAVPDVEPFYGREKELEKLRRWIVDDRSRLIVLHGLGGIGKTSLAVKAAQPLDKEFDGVIWRSLKHTPSLYDLIADIEDVIDPEYSSRTKPSIDKLLHDLNKRRYLIILDDLESIFETGEKAGQYREGYTEYGDFIKRIALEKNHQSSLVLVSREKPADLVSLENKQVHSLQIDGSTEVAQQI